MGLCSEKFTLVSGSEDERSVKRLSQLPREKTIHTEVSTTKNLCVDCQINVYVRGTIRILFIQTDDTIRCKRALRPCPIPYTKLRCLQSVDYNVTELR